MFADLRTYWSPDAVERVSGVRLTGDAAGGILHLIKPAVWPTPWFMALSGGLFTMTAVASLITVTIATAIFLYAGSVERRATEATAATQKAVS